jgi:hypothetical protein
MSAFQLCLAGASLSGLGAELGGQGYIILKNYPDTSLFLWLWVVLTYEPFGELR